ncbi:MAG: response regulator, partial [Bradymonadaceae bacterium]
MSGTDEAIRILFVDDDVELADTTARSLEAEHEQFEVETAAGASAGERKLAEHEVDCIVSDYNMPNRNGIEFLRSVRATAPTLPFILYTGKGSEEVASEAISAGVTDYMQKGTGTGEYAMLANRIDNAVARRSNRERAEVEQRLTTQNQRLRRLYEISADQQAGFHQKIRQILELGREHLGTETGFLAKVDPAGNQWEVVEATGTDERVEVGKCVPLSETYCRQTLESDGLLEVTDAPEQGWRGDPALARWGYGTYIGGVVAIRDEEYGTLCFADREARPVPFDAADRTFVDLASQWVGYELERRFRERDLREYSNYTDQLLDALDDVFYVLDREGTVERWNAKLREVTGYTDDEIEGMEPTDFFPEDHRERIAAGVEEVLDTGRARVRADYLTKDG